LSSATAATSAKRSTLAVPRKRCSTPSTPCRRASRTCALADRCSIDRRRRVHADDVDDVASPRMPFASRAATTSAAPWKPAGPVMSGRVRYGSISPRESTGIASGSIGDERTVGESRVSGRSSESRHWPSTAIEDDHVAGIDEMRIADVVTIHPPDFGPAPGILQELSAMPHNVSPRSTV
jgi:hypothetical protein